MPLVELPEEILVGILQYLSISELGKVSLVCKLLKNISDDSMIWVSHLKKVSAIEQYSTHPKTLVKSYQSLLNEDQQDGFMFFSRTHQDYKNLVIKSPVLRKNLSKDTLLEIESNNKFIC